MLQIRKAGYTVHDFNELKNVLSIGLDSVTDDCTCNCDKCEHRRVCDDIDNVLYYLDKVITNAENECSQKVHK